MAPNYRRTLTEHRKAKKGHGWTKLERIEKDCIWVNLKNVGPPFFKFTVCQFIHVSKCHLLSWKIIPSCYVAMILQMKDSWSANLMFRAHNKQN